MDEASALLLAPLAQVVLTLRAGSSIGGGGAEVNWTTASGLATTQLHVQEKHLLAACALTHVEQAFASKLSAACRTAAADPDATTAKWEGSSDWVRSEVQAHMARLLSMQVLTTAPFPHRCRPIWHGSSRARLNRSWKAMRSR